MKNEKAHIQKLIQKTNVLVKSLQPANQAYFIDLITYMALSSFLHDEGAVREQLYQMVLDYADAENDGVSASEFFGQDPQAMADELIKNSPRISMRQVLDISISVGLMMALYRLLSSFANTSYLSIAPIVYLGDIVLGLTFILLIFGLLSKTVYVERKKWQPWLVSSALIGLGLLGRHLLSSVFGNVLVFLIPHPLDVFVLGLVCTIVIVIVWKDQLLKAMIFPILAFFLVGLLKRLTEAMQITDTLWTIGLPVTIIVSSLLLFFIYSWKRMRD